ncbi:alpha/beta hydrolase [Mycobacterium hubeiense]|uniref:alpha/beta hydrolase n=1 Tax=Mycobacterium hubeiense TaxID=1867256 RepID=UPI001E64A6FF|nr:alpha/beta hydrolase [Mycobacterium sp. QGD 101]
MAASKPDRLTEASGRLATSIQSLQSQIATQQRGLADLAGGWQGTAASAALTRGEQNLKRQQELATKLGATQSALSSAGADLSALRTQIQSLAAQATALGGIVSDDGTVRSSGNGALMTPTLAAAYTTSLKSMLQQFDAVDRSAASQISQSFGGPAHQAPAPNTEKPIDELKPPEGATDTEVNQWWDSLSTEEQDRLIAERPEWIGNLDGVPGVARDAANRNRLNALRNDPNLTAEERGTLEQIDAALAGEPPRQLLVVDFDGEHPKVAVAIGNVDTADHVSVYVPGTGAVTYDKPGEGNDLPTYVQQAGWLKSETEAVLNEANKPNETVATVAWLGYEPPSNVAQAGSPHYADDNAPELASFINGIDSARDTDPHLTVLGHSYGSLLASEALQRGTAADDVVFMGSPGLETNPWQFADNVSPSDLHLSEGHVFVEHAKNDAVANLGRYGAVIPSSLPGFTDLSTNAETTSLGPRNESTGHSEYSFVDTTALYNQAVVVAGLGQDERYVVVED